MLRSPLLPHILLVAATIALLLLAFGIYQVVTASQRYDELAAIPIQPLLDAQKDNPANGLILARLEADKRGAEMARGQAFILIGGGAVLLGIVAFLYARLPESVVVLPHPPTPSQ